MDSNGIGSANVLSVIRMNGYLVAAADSSSWGSVSGGVFRSSNKGASWVRTLPDNSDALVVYGDTLYAAGINKIYRSIDTGAHWDSVANNIGDIVSLFDFKGCIFAGTSADSAFRSVSGGMLWTSCGIACRPSFAAIGSDLFAPNTSGVWVSSDNGNAWFSNKEMPGDTGEFDGVLAVNKLLIATSSTGGMLFFER